MNPRNIERTRNAYLSACGIDCATGSTSVIGAGSSDVRGGFVMNGEMENNLWSLPKEKFPTLSQQNGWSPAFAEGYVDGETASRRGNPLSCYLRIGIDQCALGFRAGYFERSIPQREAGQSDFKPDSKKAKVTLR